jgi:hypothetical protein
MSGLARLEFIKRRYRELILEPRASIAADLDAEFAYPFEDALDADQVEHPEAVGVEGI